MSFLDWLLCASYIALISFIAYRARYASSSVTDFLVAGRTITPFLGVASLAGTELGLITVMYNAQKGFTTGFAALHIAIIAGVMTYVIGKTGFIVAPLRRLKVLTIPEFYEQRFDKSTRVLGAIMLVLAGVLNMGLFLKVAALFIATISGASPTGWPLMLIMAVLLVWVLGYVLLGGMVSIVLTDFVQFVLTSCGLVMMGFILWKTVSWESCILFWETYKGPGVFNPTTQTSGFGWTYIVWMVITAGLVSTAIWPTALSRALMMKDEAAVKTQFTLASIPMAGRFFFPMLIGTFSAAYFGLDNIVGIHSLTAFPTAALALLPAGLLGLLVAGLCAAMMSTFDGYLLCWSAVITRDIFMPLSKHAWSEQKQVWAIRMCVIACGVFMYYWGMMYKGSEDVWDYLAITGAIYFTGAIPVIIGGLYWKRATAFGAKCSILAGLGALVGLEPIRQVLQLSVSGAAIGCLTVLFATSVFVIGSLLSYSAQEGASCG